MAAGLVLADGVGEEILEDRLSQAASSRPQVAGSSTQPAPLPGEVGRKSRCTDLAAKIQKRLSCLRSVRARGLVISLGLEPCVHLGDNAHDRKLRVLLDCLQE